MKTRRFKACSLLHQKNKMTSKKTKITIGISVGDVNGIGYEIILKSINDSRLFDLGNIVIYGSKNTCKHYLKSLNLENLSIHYIKNIEELKAQKANLIEVSTSKEIEIKEGQLDRNTGEFAFECLKAAATDLKENKIDALVTAPINKESIQSDEFNFPGHTEYLQDLDGAGDSLMLMISEVSKIGIVTGHIPLEKVSSSITSEKILSKINILNKSLKEDFSIEKPKIAVLGLNPHAGDNGLLGEEENIVISPAIQHAKSIGILAFGPFSADGFFASGTFKKYDAVLAMYHDQGLIPAKLFSNGMGTNYTAGLSFIRTSPDHGTAFEIAGKGLANETSFRNSIYRAIDIAKHRIVNLNLIENRFEPNKR